MTASNPRRIRTCQARSGPSKYIDGFPHVCRTIDVSSSGLLLERVSEPAVEREFYPIEIGVLDAREGLVDRMWIWAKQVWADGERQALQFVGMEPRDRQKLARLLDQAFRIEAAAAV